MPPLIKGMPVALQDHISSNLELLLLRGKVGKIHSWVDHGAEDSVCHDGIRVLTCVPKVVFVKFEAEKWLLPGMSEPGLCPIRPWKRTWFIDRHRKKTVLGVCRYQVPLAPAFAMTAHASQGQTLKAAIVDLQQGVGVSTIASYVALTRVKTRKDTLIYRPFERELFNKGELKGPTLLLKVLRGEDIDWEAIEQTMRPTKRCVDCGDRREKKEYSTPDWRDKADGWRKDCTQKMEEAGTPLRCARCHDWKTRMRIIPEVFGMDDAATAGNASEQKCGNVRNGCAI